MTPLLHSIKNTPPYVWLILAYLLFIGIKSLRTHIVYLPKLFLLPVIMLALKYKTFLSTTNFSPHLSLLLSAIASFGIHLRKKIRIIKELRAIELPGSPLTLIIVLSFFSIKYIFGFLNATHHELILSYAHLETIISMLFSGYLLGRSACFFYRYYDHKN